MPVTNLALILPDLMNRLIVLDETPSDLAASAIVKPCLDIGIDKCIDKPWSLSRGGVKYRGTYLA